MVEQILIPTSTDIVVHIPDEYLGKRVRVRVDEDDAISSDEMPSEQELKRRVEAMKAATQDFGIDTANFSFSRDAATNYE